MSHPPQESPLLQKPSPRLLAAAVAGNLLFSLLFGVGDANLKSTQFFSVDLTGQKITGPSTPGPRLTALRLLSVTTDQPQYWPHEAVFLKVLCPLAPLCAVTITLSRNQGSPLAPLKGTLQGGTFVAKILDGSTQPLEAGEWTARVKAEDGSWEDQAKFVVAAGALGALSLAHPFTPLTRSEDFEKAPGATMIINGAGVGARWGNGLHVKNELRIHGQPYSGPAQLITRCFLPGCNGVQAGDPISVTVKAGAFHGLLPVGGHSGPYGIEVVTAEGSLTHVFAHTSHVERQIIPVSGRTLENYVATLAPYEKATEVFGRGLYVAKQGNDPQAVFSVPSVSAKAGAPISFTALKNISGLKVMTFRFDTSREPTGMLEMTPDTLAKGASHQITLTPPYTLVAMGGFAEGRYEEAWFLAIAESTLSVTLTRPESASPLTEIEVDFTALDRTSGKGLALTGILEVFDTRVESTSPRDPLVSSMGDHARATGNQLAQWRDTTGLLRDSKDAEEADMSTAPTSMAKGKAKYAAKAMNMAPPPMPQAPATGRVAPKNEAPVPGAPPEAPLREGERKVVACLAVQTDATGRGKVRVTLPPQVGRVSCRLVAHRGFDSAQAEQGVDVTQKNLLETTVPAHMLPGNQVTLSVRVASQGDGLRLVGRGPALSIEKIVPVPKGAPLVNFDLPGVTGNILDLFLEDSRGTVLDRRRFEFRDPHRLPITFSDLRISDGNPYPVDAQTRLAIYPNANALLTDMAQSVEVTLQSWFPSAEPLAAQVAIRAVLLRAFHLGQLPSGGLENKYRLSLARHLTDLKEVYWDSQNHQFRCYPGLRGEAAVTSRVVDHLLRAIPHLLSSGNPPLVEEGRALDKWLKSQDLFATPLPPNLWELPVEVNGQVIFKALTDPGVAPWFIKNVFPFYKGKTAGETTGSFQLLLDRHRFLKAFERTGEAFYLLQNARALWAQKSPLFEELYGRVAHHLILVQDPGLLQGPALTGGIYASPGVLVPFLELSLDMAATKPNQNPATVMVNLGSTRETRTLTGEPLHFPVADQPFSVTAPRGTVLRLDQKKVIDPWGSKTDKAFFSLSPAPASLSRGSEGTLEIDLDPSLDPSEYVAMVLLPAHLALKLTEDNLSDSRGGRLVGQGQTGGQKIQVARVPFRGSRHMVLTLEGVWKGTGDGIVSVRHLSREDLVSSLPLKNWVVSGSSPK